MQLLVLVGKGLGRAHAGERRLNVRVDARGALLDHARDLAHLAPPGDDQTQKHREHQAHHQRKLPLHAEHDHKRPDHGKQRGDQILWPVVSELRDFKQIGGKPAHKLAGAVTVVVIEGQGLQMAEQIPADIGLHADAEGVAPVGNDKLQKRAQQIRRNQGEHRKKEDLILLFRQHGIKRPSGHQGEGQVNGGHGEGAKDINEKQPDMGLEVGQENPRDRLALVVLRLHGSCLPLQYFGSTHRCGSSDSLPRTSKAPCSGSKDTTARSAWT